MLLLAIVAACRSSQGLVLLVLDLPGYLVEAALAKVVFGRSKQFLDFLVLFVEPEFEGVLVLLGTPFFMIALLATACRHFIKFN